MQSSVGEALYQTEWFDVSRYCLVRCSYNYLNVLKPIYASFMCCPAAAATCFYVSNWVHTCCFASSSAAAGSGGGGNSPLSRVCLWRSGANLLQDKILETENHVPYIPDVQLQWYLNDASGEFCSKNFDNSLFTNSSLVFILALNIIQYNVINYSKETVRLHII